ncbi:MAG: response regulator transcription factor [Ruminococcaceae bacterium]|nr:response regulator transcription factor [Oscillospiraceae bacterium]
MDSKKKILVVEDEKNIAVVLAYNIKKEGYDCDMAHDGETGLNMALTGGYDLILLDIMLPKMTGFEVCERIRYKSQVPIIFVTAREEEKDRILGLETGADDYVTKPFSFKELMARIRANIRRSSGEVARVVESHDAPIAVGELVIDREHYSVTKNGEPVELSKKDYDFILFLAENLGVAYSREDLLEKIWGYDDYYGDIRTVDVTVSRIRKKIENDPARPEYLLTKRGIGYFLCKR